jgi:hypothetical protein
MHGRNVVLTFPPSRNTVDALASDHVQNEVPGEQGGRISSSPAKGSQGRSRDVDLDCLQQEICEASVGNKMLQMSHVSKFRGKADAE